MVAIAKMLRETTRNDVLKDHIVLMVCVDHVQLEDMDLDLVKIERIVPDYVRKVFIVQKVVPKHMNVHVVVQVIFVQKVVHPLKKFRMVIFHTHLQQNI